MYLLGGAQYRVVSGFAPGLSVPMSTPPPGRHIRPSRAALGQLPPHWEAEGGAWCWRRGEVSVAAAERGEGVPGEVGQVRRGPEVFRRTLASP